MSNRGSAYLAAGGAAVILALAAVAAPQDPWTRAQLITPEQLANELSGKEVPKPTLISVAFRVSYQSGHIPGSLYFGPGRDPKSLEALKKWASSVPKTQNTVIYCGCCPWDHCPNMRPAIELLKQMGFTRVKAMYVPTNFKTDWIDKGYPVE